MRRYRARLKTKKIDTALNDSNGKGSKKSETALQDGSMKGAKSTAVSKSDKRESDRLRQREYRSKISRQKRAILNQQRRQKYAKNKVEKQAKRSTRAAAITSMVRNSQGRISIPHDGVDFAISIESVIDSVTPRRKNCWKNGASTHLRSALTNARSLVKC